MEGCSTRPQLLEYTTSRIDGSISEKQTARAARRRRAGFGSIITSTVETVISPIPITEDESRERTVGNYREHFRLVYRLHEFAQDAIGDVLFAHAVKHGAKTRREAVGNPERLKHSSLFAECGPILRGYFSSVQ